MHAVMFRVCVRARAGAIILCIMHQAAVNCRSSLKRRTVRLTVRVWLKKRTVRLTVRVWLK